MSQMTVTAPRQLTLRPTARTQVVDAAPATGHTAFRLLCALIVVLGLAAMLMLNTARAEASYVLGRLQVQSTAAHDRVATLEAELQDAESAETLAREARRLDMVPSTSTATLRLSDGSLSGVASMVQDDRTITVDLPSTGVAKDDNSEG